MKFRIHYEIESFGETIGDSFIVDGDTIDEIREKANLELLKRGGVNPWSEEV